MVNGLDIYAFNKALDTINECGGSVVISDLELVINGKLIDVIKAETTWDDSETLHFYAGNPLLDGTDDEQDWEELELSIEVMNAVLNDFNDLF